LIGLLYTETISEYTDIILERLPKLIKRYDDVLNNTGQLQLQFKENEQEYRDKVSLNRALCQDRLYDLEKKLGTKFQVSIFPNFQLIYLLRHQYQLILIPNNLFACV
jgi:uncharacterized membrane protein